MQVTFINIVQLNYFLLTIYMYDNKNKTNNQLSKDIMTNFKF